MTTIKATCPTCGEVGLSPSEIELRVHAADHTASFYSFACPRCLCVVRKPADERVVQLLASGGVECLPLYAEPLVTPSIRLDGPPISHDDLLDFHALLRTDEWFAELLADVMS